MNSAWYKFRNLYFRVGNWEESGPYDFPVYINCVDNIGQTHHMPVCGLCGLCIVGVRLGSRDCKSNGAIQVNVGHGRNMRYFCMCLMGSTSFISQILHKPESSQSNIDCLFSTLNYLGAHVPCIQPFFAQLLIVVLVFLILFPLPHPFLLFFMICFYSALAATGECPHTA